MNFKTACLTATFVGSLAMSGTAHAIAVGAEDAVSIDTGLVFSADTNADGTPNLRDDDWTIEWLTLGGEEEFDDAVIYEDFPGSYEDPQGNAQWITQDLTIDRQDAAYIFNRTFFVEEDSFLSFEWASDNSSYVFHNADLGDFDTDGDPSNGLAGDGLRGVVADLFESSPVLDTEADAAFAAAGNLAALTSKESFKPSIPNGFIDNLLLEGGIEHTITIVVANWTGGGLNPAGLLVQNSSISAVPVPAALPLMLTGLLGLGVLGRRKIKA